MPPIHYSKCIGATWTLLCSQQHTLYQNRSSNSSLTVIQIANNMSFISMTVEEKSIQVGSESSLVKTKQQQLGGMYGSNDRQEAFSQALITGSGGEW